MLVPRAGLEPAHLAALVPEISAISSSGAEFQRFLLRNFRQDGCAFARFVGLLRSKKKPLSGPLGFHVDRTGVVRLIFPAPEV